MGLTSSGRTTWVIIFTSPKIVFTDFLLFNKSVTVGEEVEGHVCVDKRNIRNQANNPFAFR